MHLFCATGTREMFTGGSNDPLLLVPQPVPSSTMVNVVDFFSLCTRGVALSSCVFTWVFTWVLRAEVVEDILGAPPLVAREVIFETRILTDINHAL